MASNWAASALHWWHEAGVDTILDEAPRDWLNAAPAPAAKAAAAPEAPPKPPLPATLAEFQAWLLASGEVPCAAAGATRVGPSGNPACGLTILIDMPSAADSAAGRLLSGEAGALFDKMMAAIGRDRDSLYLASLSPCRTPTGSFDAASAAALRDIAVHHVALAAPRALLLFGDACARLLLGSAVAAARGKWHELATPAGPVRALATIRPEKLINQPNLKKHAWEDLQMLMEGLKP